jgi:hypothetical protein
MQDDDLRFIEHPYNTWGEDERERFEQLISRLCEIPSEAWDDQERRWFGLFEQLISRLCEIPSEAWDDRERRWFRLWLLQLFKLPGETWDKEEKRRFILSLFLDKKLLALVVLWGSGRIAYEDAGDWLHNYILEDLKHFFKSYDPEKSSAEYFFKFCFKRYIWRKLGLGGGKPPADPPQDPPPAPGGNKPEIVPDPDGELIGSIPDTDPSANPELSAEQEATKAFIHALLRKLEQEKELYCQVIELRIFRGLHHDQIGKLFGKTEGAIKVIYNRAWRRLLTLAMQELLSALELVHPIYYDVIMITEIEQQSVEIAARKLGIARGHAYILRCCGMQWLRQQILFEDPWFLSQGRKTKTPVKPTPEEQLLRELRVLPVDPVGDHVTEQEFSDYLLAKLSGSDTQRIDDHLVSCEHCSSSLEKRLP